MDIHPCWDSQVWQEIAEKDTYRLRTLAFVPKTVFDLGANRGCFTAYAKFLWPRCTVVAVEANAENFRHLQLATAEMPDVTCLHAAVADGPAYWLPGGNDATHTYTSPTLSAPVEALQAFGSPCSVAPVLLDEVAANAVPPYIVKVDIEGGEQCLLHHEPSNAVLRAADFWTTEIHFYAAELRGVRDKPPAHWETHGEVVTALVQWAYSFTPTHSVELLLRQNGGMVWATKT